MLSKKRTRIDIRVFEDRRTTRRSDMMMLTTIPTSMFQMIENTKVSVMSAMSTHDRILVICNESLQQRKKGVNALPVI